MSPFQAIDKNRIEELGGVIRVKEGQIETLKEQQVSACYPLSSVSERPPTLDQNQTP